jgi:transmembrane sensor
MKKEIIDNLIARYVAGECSVQEEIKISRWMDENPDQKILIQNLLKKWKAGTNRSYAFDVETALDRLNEELGQENTVHSYKTVPSQAGKIKRKRPSFMKQLLRVAAILLVLGFTALYFIQQSDDTQQVEMQNVVTERGQRANIQLDDGSSIQLSVNSQLLYPDNFGTDSRSVHLSGEAYFEVVHDDRPFLVYTDNVIIRILGTEFNVQSYDDGEEVQVLVANGKVAVRTTSAPDVDEAILEKGDLAQLQRDGQDEIIISRNVDLNRYLGWLDYRLEFEDTPLKEVVKKLERWYNIDIHLSDSDLYGMRLTATFENERIDEILTALKYSLQLEYEIFEQDREIMLFPGS